MTEFSDIESELRKLRPIQPSPQLYRTIEQAIQRFREVAAPGSGVRTARHWAPYNWLSAGLGLAVTAALLIVARIELKSRHQRDIPGALQSSESVVAPETTPAEFVPTGLTQIVYRMRDEGLLFPAGADQPVRRLRAQARETLRWRDLKTGASLRVSYPSEEIFLVPISGQ
jgi:hypothetical protein